MLIAAGGNVRATTRLGSYTPLLLASQGGHPPVIDALVAAGADLKGTTAAGVTPLMLASASGQAAAVTALIAHGADVNATEPTRGETALDVRRRQPPHRRRPRADRGEGGCERGDEGGQPQGRAAESGGGGVSRRRCGGARRADRVRPGGAGANPGARRVHRPVRPSRGRRPHRRPVESLRVAPRILERRRRRRRPARTRLRPTRRHPRRRRVRPARRRPSRARRAEPAAGRVAAAAAVAAAPPASPACRVPTPTRN